MKKLLTFGVGLVLCLSVTFSASAQTAANKLLSSNTAALNRLIDTVTNTGVKYQLTGVISGYADILTVQAVITKVSGTVAGSLILQGTLDGVNYITIGSAATPTDVATQSFSFPLTSHPYIQYRLSYTGAGTMSAKISSYWIARKRT